MKKTESKIVDHGPDCRMCNVRRMEVILAALSNWEKFAKEYEHTCPDPILRKNLFDYAIKNTREILGIKK